MAGDVVVVGQHLEFTIVTALGPQTALTILHAAVTGPIIGTPTTQDMANAADAYWDVQWKAMISFDARYRGTGCRLIDSPPTRRMFAGVTGAGLCTDAAIPLAGQTRGLVSWRTIFAGKHYRGRSYIPWPSVNQTSAGNQPVAGYVALLTTWANLWNSGAVVLTAGGNSATVTPSIRNRITGGMTYISDSVQRQVWATQKRSGNLGRPNPPPF